MSFLKEEEYKEKFKEDKKKRKALDRAWKNRDFEIEMYWKRASYFWLFITAAFTGSFALLAIKCPSQEVFFARYVVLCVGFCFSICWILVNRGSKKWQENWEAHIDMLEDEITGPIYKIVKNKSGYNWSVSKVNMFVSWLVCAVWLSLIVAFWIFFDYSYCKLGMTLMAFTSFFITFGFICWLILNKKGDEKYCFYERKYTF